MFLLHLKTKQSTKVIVYSVQVLQIKELKCCLSFFISRFLSASLALCFSNLTSSSVCLSIIFSFSPFINLSLFPPVLSKSHFDSISLFTICLYSVCLSLSSPCLELCVTFSVPSLLSLPLFFSVPLCITLSTPSLYMC